MDNSATTIVMVVLAAIVFVAMGSIAMFVTSDEFKDIMAENETIEVKESPKIANSTNASVQVVTALSWKRSTINNVLEAFGVDTSKKDHAYESRAMVYTVTKLLTLFLVFMAVVIGGISLFMFIREQFRKST
jgi:uncharacterized protein YneF (UPF0154 family)